jgi:hypothetical protein
MALLKKMVNDKGTAKDMYPKIERQMMLFAECDKLEDQILKLRQQGKDEEHPRMLQSTTFWRILQASAYDSIPMASFCQDDSDDEHKETGLPRAQQKPASSSEPFAEESGENSAATSSSSIPALMHHCMSQLQGEGVEDAGTAKKKAKKEEALPQQSSKRHSLVFAHCPRRVHPCCSFLMKFGAVEFCLRRGSYLFLSKPDLLALSCT